MSDFYKKQLFEKDGSDFLLTQEVRSFHVLNHVVRLKLRVTRLAKTLLTAKLIHFLNKNKVILILVGWRRESCIVSKKFKDFCSR